MAKKKETTNEAKVAAAAPEELDTAVSQEHGEPEAAPVVADGSGDAAETPSAELGEEPAGEIADADGSVSDDESDDGQSEVPAQAEEAGAGGDVANATDTEPGATADMPPINDGDGSTDGADDGIPTAGDDQPDSNGDPAPGDDIAYTADQPSGGPDPAPDAGGAPEGTCDPDGGDGGDDAAAPIDSMLNAVDDAVTAAEMAANCVRHHVNYAAYPDSWRMLLFSGQSHSRATNAMAACIRNIGHERAQPLVLAQQLKILDIIDDAELTAAEALVVKIFADTLAVIDAFNQAEAARLEAEFSAAKEPAPWPTDETTLERVDEPLETW